MHAPRLPDWLVYATIVTAILVVAQGRREHADAPEAPPPVPGAANVPIAPSSPFAPDHVLPVSGGVETAAGTAFSVADGGVWVTARHVVEGCRQPAIVVAEGRGVAARLLGAQGDVAVLSTTGGAPGLRLAATAPRRGETAFHPGFPQGRPGEAASRLLGSQTMRARARGVRAQTLTAWADIGRTEDIKGDLSGLSGAPALNAAGAVVGVTVAEGPRRGRIYTAPLDTLRAALLQAGVSPASNGAAQPMTVDNYGRVADSLRRDLRVVQVVCLAG